MRQSRIISCLICFELFVVLAWLNISRPFATVAVTFFSYLRNLSSPVSSLLQKEKNSVIPNTWLKNSGELLVMARRRDSAKLLAVTHGGVPVIEPEGQTPARAPASVL
jgi:hypothetical protein